MISPSSFIDALHSPGPAPDRTDKLALYAFLVGHWTYEATYRPPGEPARRSTGEIHAGWVLEGRAIQDVWIVPARDLPRPAAPQMGDYYGTTLRVYDPALDAWHILWSDPWTQTYRRQLGRARGRDIVQEGSDAQGAHRWSFTEITADSFRWTGELSPNEDGNWLLLADFRVRRLT